MSKLDATNTVVNSVLALNFGTSHRFAFLKRKFAEFSMLSKPFSSTQLLECVRGIFSIEPGKPWKSNHAFQSKGRRLLIVDDNRDNVEALRTFLVSRGYSVETTFNGWDAFKLVRQKSPDLVLMDIQMPGMNGLESMHRIRELPGRAHLPLIALTSLAMPEDRIRCFEAGANDYIVKPVSLRSLAEIIEIHLVAGDSKTPV